MTKVKDLHFAAYLHAIGVPLLDMEGSRPTYFVFDLSDEEAKQKTVEWMGEGQVVARKFSNSLKLLKDSLSR